MATVRLYAEQVTDWKSFHSLCRKTFGFPDFYAENMDAWIDCMSDLREDGGLTDIRLAPDEVLFIEVSGTESLNKLFPEILNEIVVSTAFVNQRYSEAGEQSALCLVFS